MIEIRHLKKQFESSTPLVDVNATIDEGDSIAVIGPSGTGKSTLLRCINLLEKPTSGQIILNGEDITDPNCNINRVRTKIGMVFQSFNLYEHLTVVENCMLAQRVLLKKSRQEAYDKAMELLSSVGMGTRALQYPSQLSGGQKQRVAIARTLSTDPDIVLFDEPTSALDPLSVGEVESVIDDLSKQGRTMMIVTHSMPFAKRISNRVFYMDQGGIYEDGSPKQIFDYPQKELTKKFILHRFSIDLNVTEENHDLTSELDTLFNFCTSKGVNSQRTLNLCKAYEEYYAMLSRYSFDDVRSVQVHLEYDKSNEKLTLSFTPGSMKPWDTIEDTIRNSLEYKLFTRNLKEYSVKESKTEDGSKVRYSYEL